MNEYQLVFRGVNGEADRKEFRFHGSDGEPRIDGRLVVDGETYSIRGVDWLVNKDGSSGDVQRFICTLVVEPVDQ